MEDIEILYSSLKSLKIIKNCEKNNILDLSDVTFSTPFLITPITAFYNISSKKPKIIFPKNKCTLSYLKTINFPKTYKNLKNANIKKETYSPLYEIENSILSNNNEILNLLNRILINKYNLKNNINIIFLIFDELLCNIQEHSNSKFNCLQIQKYNDKIAISIVDTGITIPISYIKKNIDLINENDTIFLEYALKGISTKNEELRGTGIPNTYKLVCDAFKGSFLIISREGGLLKIPKKDLIFFNLKEYNLKFNGTIINILFKITDEKIDYTKHIFNL